MTAVYDGGHSFLAEARASLERQVLPPGWALEWLVQEDGLTGEPLRALPDAPWISKGSCRKGGAAVARTVALSRATGDIVRALDADDLLTPGALSRDISALARARTEWCISSCLDLLPDGSLLPGPYDPQEGPLEFRELMAGFTADLFPVVGTHLAVRTGLLHALGGWPALPAWETIALVLRCAAVAPGWMISEPGGIYRKHPEQTTARSEYGGTTDFAALKSLITHQALACAAPPWAPGEERHSPVTEPRTPPPPPRR
ncbi:glycosyltransferase [Streptomyces sp. NPDC094437]|uniref:glycosyltransferase n=1 Tax=Streptomyces sp. NPDC094437 TaxID=3366060 RepID=UPI003825E94E